MTSTSNIFARILAGLFLGIIAAFALMVGFAIAVGVLVVGGLAYLFYFRRKLKPIVADFKAAQARARQQAGEPDGDVYEGEFSVDDVKPSDDNQSRQIGDKSSGKGK